MSLAASRRQLAADALGIGVSAAGFGFVYGLSAREAGFSPIEAMAMSKARFIEALRLFMVRDISDGLAPARQGVVS